MPVADTRRQIRALKSLSSPPGSIARIFSLAAAAQSSANELARAIEVDPAVTARLLKLANSAYFGFPARVASVSKAVVVLGYRTVQNLAACVSLAPSFRGGAGFLDRCALWLHSCAVAEAARVIALERSADGPLAYLAGLLHDIGQVVLDEAVPDRYRDVLAQATLQSTGLATAERNALGIDHGEAAALLGEQWNLPEALVVVLRGHIDCGEDAPDLVRMVSLAEHLAESDGFSGTPIRESPDLIPKSLLRSLDLPADRLEAIEERFKLRHDAIEILHRESWQA